MLLELQNLGKSFGEHEVLRDVNAGVERGDRIGIIGANGTGKTTLLRILCGESLPDAGDAAFGTGVTTGYLEQNARLDPSLDIYATMRLVFTPALDAMQEMDALQKQLAADPHNAELTEKIAHCTAVIDAMDAYNMDTQIKKVLNGMGFPADTWTKLAGVLSGGEQTRLRLARLLLERPDLLILDEPTNHLDLETMEWLENYLKAYRGAVLVVSHDRYFLDAVCTRIWELRGKSIKTYRGNYSAYLPQREAADERQQKLHDAAVEKAAKLQDYVDRNLVRASTTKMAQSRRKQLEKLEITGASISVNAPSSTPWTTSFTAGTSSSLQVPTARANPRFCRCWTASAARRAVWSAWAAAPSRAFSPSSRPAAQAASLTPSGTSTRALPSSRSAVIWHASATAARRSLRTVRRCPAVSWPACALPSWRSNART